MEVVRPSTLDEALAAKAADPAAELLAGGTDLMVEVNMAKHRPAGIVALRRIAELNDIEDRRIGAGVTWKALETGPFPAMAQIARTVGSPQIRSAGTLGGNIGTASPAGDGLPWLAALDAEIELMSAARGVRRMKWNDFFLGVKQTAIADDEIITAALLPEDLPGKRQFAKIGVRNAMVISTVSAVVMRWRNGETRVALGSVAPTPMRATAAEAMISAESDPSPAALQEFARLVSEEVRPITDHRSTAAYRRHAAGVLARRLLERCLAS